MATCASLQASTNYVVADSTPLDSCTSYILMDASTYHSWAPFDPATLSPVVVVEAFSAGFIVFGIPLILCWAASHVLSMLKSDE